MNGRDDILVLFASDLHGNLSLYGNCLALIRDRRPSMFLLGGDLLPNWSPRESLLEDQRAFINSHLRTFLESIHGLDGRPEVGLMLGNEDCLALSDELLSLSRGGLFRLLNGAGFTTSSGWHALGFNLVPETPFALKDVDRRDYESDPIKHPQVDAFRSTASGLKHIKPRDWLESHESIAAELYRLGSVEDPRHTIFVSHSPPYDTVLDMTMDGGHVGSRAIRAYIKVNHPLVSLHGHIHESFHQSGRCVCRLGDTVCFNPGQIHAPVLDAVLFHTSDPWRHHEHTAGAGMPTKSGLDMLPLRYRRERQ
jgi:Icc-related predicted phosphoesterase